MQRDEKLERVFEMYNFCEILNRAENYLWSSKKSDVFLVWGCSVGGRVGVARTLKTQNENLLSHHPVMPLSFSRSLSFFCPPISWDVVLIFNAAYWIKIMEFNSFQLCEFGIKVPSFRIREWRSWQFILIDTALCMMSVFPSFSFHRHLLKFIPIRFSSKWRCYKIIFQLVAENSSSSRFSFLHLSIRKFGRNVGVHSCHVAALMWS